MIEDKELGLKMAINEDEATAIEALKDVDDLIKNYTNNLKIQKLFKSALENHIKFIQQSVQTTATP